MRIQRRFVSAGWGLALALAGCSTQSASNYTTAQIWAQIAGLSQGQSTTVTATFTTGQDSLTYIELTKLDTIQATTGTTTQKLAQSSSLGVVNYSNSFNVTQGQFVVSLARGCGVTDSGAPNSTLTVPAAFTIDQAQNGSYSRAQSLTLSWQTVSDPNGMSISIDGTCIQPYSTTVPAGTNQLVIPAGTIQKLPPPSNGQSIPDSCQATATLDRSQNGTLDTDYKGGTITGTQERSLSFTTTL